MRSQEEDRLASPCSSSRHSWRLRPSSSGCYQQASTRHRFLDAYKHDLEKEELNANAILRSFDLTGGLVDHWERRDVQIDDGVSNDPPSGYPTQAGNPTDNPYLSTPLRQKHFSRLSPTILREILRSPSLRVPTPEASSAEGSSSYPVKQNDLIHSSLDLKTVCSKLPLDDNNSISLPLTPPPSAKIPALMSFLPDAHIPPLGAPSTGSYMDNRLDYPANEPTSPKPSPKYRSSLQSLVCPIAQRNFQLVIDELTGTERRGSHVISLPPLPMLSPSRVNDDNATSSTNPDSKPPTHTCRVGKHQPLSLTQEFTTLLIQRAQLEEEEAQQLKALAHRLESLARDRRKLSEVVASTHSKEHNNM